MIVTFHLILILVLASPNTGHFVGKEIRLGSRGDSYYEYLLKQYLQTEKSEPMFWEMYQEAMKGVLDHLVVETKHQKYVFVGELLHGKDSTAIHPKMDHLVCFLAGNLVLGATQGKKLAHSSLGEDAKAQLQLGLDLCRTCYEMYNQTATGLAPEIVYFHQPDEDKKNDDDMFIQSLDRHNLLRPETVESLFIIYQITGDKKYREWGWVSKVNILKKL